MNKIYYRLNIEEVKPLTGIVLQAVRECIACHHIVDGIGGGHGFICVACKEILERGYLREEFSVAKDELIKQTTEAVDSN